MRELSSSRSDPSQAPLVGIVLRILTLLLPALLLLLASSRAEGTSRTMLCVGGVFQVVVCCFSFLSRRSWRQPAGPSVIALYLIALGWLWVGADVRVDWFPHLAQAILLVVPLSVFALQTLANSGAHAIRHARLLADRLAARKDWPAELDACRGLPEVKAFREALHVDAAPALALLDHARPQVRIAALAALEFRKDWRPGQAERVLILAHSADQPAVRAAALAALANLDDRLLIEAVAEFLRDPSAAVRRAAAEALLWDAERRWPWIRYTVRFTLADPAHASEGALPYQGQSLPPEAVHDLHAWAAEKGVLAIRAALTLGDHYDRALPEQPDEELVERLGRLLVDPHTPPGLRLELARVLQKHRAIDLATREKLLDPANPAPLRLVAADSLLAEGRHAAALAALHEVARLPNREMALATAAVVQCRLGVDLGLDPDGPPPGIHSRQAAEVTRRVMTWAARQDLPENVVDSAPLHR